MPLAITIFCDPDKSCPYITYPVMPARPSGGDAVNAKASLEVRTIDIVGGGSNSEEESARGRHTKISASSSASKVRGSRERGLNLRIRVSEPMFEAPRATE